MDRIAMQPLVGGPSRIGRCKGKPGVGVRHINVIIGRQAGIVDDVRKIFRSECTHGDLADGPFGRNDRDRAPDNVSAVSGLKDRQKLTALRRDPTTRHIDRKIRGEALGENTPAIALDGDATRRVG
ncbi:MAG TPA: hypothetical protein VIO38_13600, partial [Rariglobus sp.]